MVVKPRIFSTGALGQMQSRSSTESTSRQSRATITTRRKMASLRVSLQRRQGRSKEQVQAGTLLLNAEDRVDLKTAKHLNFGTYSNGVHKQVRQKLNLGRRR